MLLIYSFLLIFFYILYTILIDTSGIHGIELFQFPIWITFLSIYSGIYSFKFFRSLEKTRENDLFKIVVIFYFFSSFFLIFEINQKTLLLIIYNGLLIALFVFWILFSRLEKHPIIYAYVGVLAISGIITISSYIFPILNQYLLFLQELLIFFAFLYRFTKLELKSKLTVFLSSVIGMLVSIFVNNSDILNTIIRILIEQIFGVSSATLLFISSPIILSAHITLLFAFFSQYLVTKDHSWLLLLLTGISFAIGPVVIIRAILLHHILFTYNARSKNGNSQNKNSYHPSAIHPEIGKF